MLICVIAGCTIGATSDALYGREPKTKVKIKTKKGPKIVLALPRGDFRLLPRPGGVKTKT